MCMYIYIYYVFTYLFTRVYTCVCMCIYIYMCVYLGLRTYTVTDSRQHHQIQQETLSTLGFRRKFVAEQLHFPASRFEQRLARALGLLEALKLQNDASAKAFDGYS